jgi:hypothetical protein
MALYHPANLRLLEEMKPLHRLPPIERVPSALPDGFLPPANGKGPATPPMPPVISSTPTISRRKTKKEKKEDLKASATGGVAALTAGKTPLRRAVKEYLQMRIDELSSD